MNRRLAAGPGRWLMVLMAGVGAVLVAALPGAPLAGAPVSAAAPAWRIEPSPDPAGASSSGLDAVSCSGWGRCVAVGSAEYPSGQPLPGQLPLVERLSNGAWTVASTPTPRGATGLLNGVACPLAGFCAAVGSIQYPDPTRSGPLAETWTGTSWEIDTLPTPVGAQDPSLAAVSCAADDRCVAVGNYLDAKTDTYRPLAERLDGQAWSLVPSPDPRGPSANSEFTGVACVTPTACEVVGNVGYNDTLQNVFAYGLRATTWTAQHQVNPGPTPGNTDNAVSCSAVFACTSVGSVWVVAESALAEYWNGSTWVRQTTPAPVHRPANTLLGVSCVGGTSCVAVGAAARVDPKNGHLGPYHAMADVWNGTAWTQSLPAGRMGVIVGLSAVSCRSPGACIAVGGASTKTSESTLVEAYSG